MLRGRDRGCAPRRGPQPGGATVSPDGVVMSVFISVGMDSPYYCTWVFK